MKGGSVTMTTTPTDRMVQIQTELEQLNATQPVCSDAEIRADEQTRLLRELEKAVTDQHAESLSQLGDEGGTAYRDTLQRLHSALDTFPDIAADVLEFGHRALRGRPDSRCRGDRVLR